MSCVGSSAAGPATISSMATASCCLPLPPTQLDLTSAMARMPCEGWESTSAKAYSIAPASICARIRFRRECVSIACSAHASADHSSMTLSASAGPPSGAFTSSGTSSQSPQSESRCGDPGGTAVGSCAGCGGTSTGARACCAGTSTCACACCGGTTPGPWTCCCGVSPGACARPGGVATSTYACHGGSWTCCGGISPSHGGVAAYACHRSSCSRCRVGTSPSHGGGSATDTGASCCSVVTTFTSNLGRTTFEAPRAAGPRLGPVGLLETAGCTCT
mmetsp:Transcript_78942/g.223404  ORF Transcript_78942/g.223404 Transcript_78942/m.223404 type:complete len:275 (+) Transcript_78942:497-1321(+)